MNYGCNITNHVRHKSVKMGDKMLTHKNMQNILYYSFPYSNLPKIMFWKWNPIDFSVNVCKLHPSLKYYYVRSNEICAYMYDANFKPSISFICT